VRRETSVVRRVVGFPVFLVHAVRSVVIFTTETRRSRRFTEYCVVSVLCVPLCTLCTFLHLHISHTFFMDLQYRLCGVLLLLVHIVGNCLG